MISLSPLVRLASSTVGATFCVTTGPDGAAAGAAGGAVGTAAGGDAGGTSGGATGGGVTAGLCSGADAPGGGAGDGAGASVLVTSAGGDALSPTFAVGERLDGEDEEGGDDEDDEDAEDAVWRGAGGGAGVARAGGPRGAG